MNAKKEGVMRLLSAGLVLLLTVLVAACGGGSGGGDSGSGGGSAGGGGGGGGGTPAPTGIQLSAAFQQGSFIEFAVNTENSSFSSLGTNNDSDFGIFRITLGAPTTIGGATVFPITVTGDTSVGSTIFAPRWTHIGIRNGSVVGSTNGSTLQTIYNAQTLTAVSAGFFITFGATENVTASNGTFTAEYNTLPAVLASHAGSDGGCETIFNITFCEDSSTTFSETEYYKNGIGPIGYKRDVSFSSCGGGFCSSHQVRVRIEVVGTSLAPADGSTIRPAPWRDAASMSTARKVVTASVYNGEIYVFGGINTAGTSLSTVEIYNPTTNTWRPGVSAPVALSFYQAATVGSRTYLINQAASVRIFDHLAGAWTSGATSPFDDPSFDVDTWVDPATGNPFVVVISSEFTPQRIDVFGYNVASNFWGQSPSLTTTDHRFFAMRILGDSAVVAGGFRQFSSSNKTFNGTYRHDILGAAGTQWVTSGLGTLQTRRHRARAVNLNGTMYLLGGLGGDGGPVLRDVESYTTASNVWTAKPKMLRARYEHAAVALDGKIYVIGGTNDSSGTALATMEVFTP